MSRQQKEAIRATTANLWKEILTAAEKNVLVKTLFNSIAVVEQRINSNLDRGSKAVIFCHTLCGALTKSVNECNRLMNEAIKDKARIIQLERILSEKGIDLPEPPNP